MEDLIQWLLVNILSPLLLPLFLIGMLCVIADVRPEPVITGVLKIFGGIIQFVLALVTLIFKYFTGVRGRK